MVALHPPSLDCRMPWRPSPFFEHHKKSFRRSKPWAKKLPSESIPTKGAVERATWKLSKDGKDGNSFRGICFTTWKVVSDSCRFDVATKPFWMFVALCKSWFTSSKGAPTSGFEELPRKTWTELASCDALVAGSGTTTFWRRSPGKGWKHHAAVVFNKIVWLPSQDFDSHPLNWGCQEMVPKIVSLRCRKKSTYLTGRHQINSSASSHQNITTARHWRFQTWCPNVEKKYPSKSQRHLKAFLPPSRSSDSLDLQSDLIADPPCCP